MLPDTQFDDKINDVILRSLINRRRESIVIIDDLPVIPLRELLLITYSSYITLIILNSDPYIPANYEININKCYITKMNNDTHKDYIHKKYLADQINYADFCKNIEHNNFTCIKDE